MVANLTFGLMISGIFGFQFMTALYLQRVLGYEPAQVGLGIAPVAVAIAVMSLGVAPRLWAASAPWPLCCPAWCCWRSAW